MTTLRAATLTDIRLGAGLGPTEAAKRMGVPRRTLHRMETATNTPALESLRAFASAVGGCLELIVRIPGKDPVLLMLPPKIGTESPANADTATATEEPDQTLSAAAE